MGSAACPVVPAGRIRVLLVEPRRIYADTLARRLRTGDFAVAVASSEAAALAGLRDVDPDVVVVCVGSDERSIAILDRIRQVAQAGVVALSDRDITPLLSNVGVVPRGDAEVLNTRIRLALRCNRVGIDSHRGGVSDEMQRRENGELVVDVAARKVYQRGIAIPLTRMEFAILRALSECPGEPLTWRQLQEILWGNCHSGGRSALGVHVGNLRRKLGEDPASPRYLLTVRGIGYCLVG